MFAAAHAKDETLITAQSYNADAQWALTRVMDTQWRGRMPHEKDYEALTDHYVELIGHDKYLSNRPTNWANKLLLQLCTPAGLADIKSQCAGNPKLLKIAGFFHSVTNVPSIPLTALAEQERIPLGTAYPVPVALDRLVFLSAFHTMTIQLIAKIEDWSSGRWYEELLTHSPAQIMYDKLSFKPGHPCYGMLDYLVWFIKKYNLTQG